MFRPIRRFLSTPPAAATYLGNDRKALCAERHSYLDRGYTVVKMKIGGADLAEDQRRIEAVLAEVRDYAKLAVDANGWQQVTKNELI